MDIHIAVAHLPLVFILEKQSFLKFFILCKNGSKQKREFINFFMTMKIFSTFLNFHKRAKAQQVHGNIRHTCNNWET